MKHLHITLVVLFLLSYLIKTILLFAGKGDILAKYRKKSLVPEMMIAILFVITGLYQFHAYGWNMGGWFHVKLTLVILAIPLGIIGFKKNNKVLAGLSTLIFIYVFFLALTKSLTLYF